MNRRSDPILALFFVSGFAGLIYESVWSHYVKLFLGHAAYAQTLVLVVFMGGLAFGAWLCARVAGRVANPLRLYAMVELAIGLMAFAFHAIFVVSVDWAYASLLPATCEQGGSFCASQWLLSALLLAPQSILLGATFPLVCSAALRLDATQPGHDLAALYFLNSLGAVLGVIASAFLLLPAVGLHGTLVTAGVANVFIALIAYRLSREVPRPLDVPAVEAAADSRALSDRSLGRLLIATALLTGLSSFIYEVVWIRMLSLVLGASTHSFELMLASFILGLALGGLWIRSRVDGIGDDVKFLGRVQIVMGLAAVATLPFYNATFDFMAWILHSVARNEAGFVIFSVSSTLIALFVMLPATFCAGMTLPLITYRLLRSPSGERALGMVYAANTIGAILGVVICVHVLFEWLGVRGALLVGAAIDVGLGVVLLGSAGRGARRIPLGREAITGLAVLVLMALFFEMDPRRVSSGVFRSGVARLPADQPVLFHRDGKTATVDVIDANGLRAIRTNGKSDAAMSLGKAPAEDEHTMALLALLPLGHRPEARTAAVIGLGAGMSTSVLLGSPSIERVDTVEIEPAIVDAARLFRPAVDAAFADPRSRIVIDDAKSFFARGRHRYDIIVSEPSNPWVSGVASLFTEEFYARLSEHLVDGGVLSQWLHTYELDAATLASIVAAVSKTFPDFVIYSSVDSDIILIARKGGGPGAFDEATLRFPNLKPLLERLRLTDAQVIRRRAVANSVAIQPFLRTYGVAANSDYFPFVDHRVSRTRFTQARVTELIDLQAAPMPLLEMIGASPVPVQSRHEAQAVAYIEWSTHLAWGMRDIIMGEPVGAPIGPDLMAAHLVREWIGCRSGLAFGQVLPSLVGLSQYVNSRLHPDVAAQVWRRIGESPCVKALAESERRWLDLFLAIAQRDTRRMLATAPALLDSVDDVKSTASELALFATVVSLVCDAQPQRAQAILHLGMPRWVRSGQAGTELRLLRALAQRPAARCDGKPSQGGVEGRQAFALSGRPFER